MNRSKTSNNRCTVKVVRMSVDKKEVQEVVLRSASSKWMYKTTVDDPLFRPILGAMLEEGMEIPSELTLEGSVGEVIEEDWEYVCRLNGIMLVTTPNTTVWRHELARISNILDLPEGWEAYTAVDKRTPLEERVNHMRASHAYLMKHSHVMEQHRRMARDAWTALSHLSDKVDQYGYGFDPLIRNLYLIAEGNIRDSHVRMDERTISLAILLLYIDWEVAKILIVDHESSTSEGNRLIRRMNNEFTRCYFNLPLKKSMIEGLGFAQMGTIDATTLEQWYIRLFSALPARPTIAALGLEPIIGEPYVSSWGGHSRVRISDIVAWVNSNVLTYLSWYLHNVRSGETEVRSSSHDVILISRQEFPELVELLAETVGMHAMKCMLATLRKYVSDLRDGIASAENDKHKDRRSDEKLKRRATMKKRSERASLFATLLQQYINSHLDGDEGVRTLALGNLPRVKKLDNYFD